MKLCSFEANGRPSYGICQADGSILDLPAKLGPDAPADLGAFLSVLALNGRALPDVLMSAPGPTQLVKQADVNWLPPITRPSKVVGVAINNSLAQGLAHRPSKTPAFFLKPPSALVGHGANVRVRKDFGVTHPEPELAVIIGKRASKLTEQNALDYVFGYSIMNDITSPGLKERDSLELVMPKGFGGAYVELQGWRHNRDDDHARSVYLTYHALSKGADTFGPMGPWVVTKDEVPDPNNLAINSYVGDELVFQDSTAKLTFSVEQVLAHLSSYMTLEPGDIVHMGTSMRPAEGGQFALLTHWDITKHTAPMRIEVQGIGALENPVVVEDH